MPPYELLSCGAPSAAPALRMAFGPGGRPLAQAVPPAMPLHLLVQAGEVGVVGHKLRVVLVLFPGHPGIRPAGADTRAAVGVPARPDGGAGTRTHRKLNFRFIAGIGVRLEFIADGLHPEDHAEYGEDRPFERIGPAQRVTRFGAMELPVAEPQHPEHGDHRERMPAEPPRGDEEEPPRPGPNAGHAQSLAPRQCWPARWI